jgi:hypothetical protein
MSKKNYFEIHKNKKPKRRLENTNWKSFYDVVESANKLVKSLIELQNSMYDFSKVKYYSELRNQLSIPKYKKERVEELAIVGDNSNHEYFVSLKGEKYRIKPPFDYEKYSKDHFDIDLKRIKASKFN